MGRAPEIAEIWAEESPFRRLNPSHRHTRRWIPRLRRFSHHPATALHVDGGLMLRGLADSCALPLSGVEAAMTEDDPRILVQPAIRPGGGDGSVRRLHPARLGAMLAAGPFASSSPSPTPSRPGLVDRPAGAGEPGWVKQATANGHTAAYAERSPRHAFPASSYRPLLRRFHCANNGVVPASQPAGGVQPGQVGLRRQDNSGAGGDGARRRASSNLRLCRDAPDHADPAATTDLPKPAAGLRSGQRPNSLCRPAASRLRRRPVRGLSFRHKRSPWR